MVGYETLQPVFWFCGKVFRNDAQEEVILHEMILWDGVVREIIHSDAKVLVSPRRVGLNQSIILLFLGTMHQF